jgi:hypothetical protein
MTRERRLVPPHGPVSHARSAPASGRLRPPHRLTAAPGITPRTTAHFYITSSVVFADLSADQVQASIDDVAAHCEQDFQNLVSLFGFEPQVQFQVDLSGENSGAYHFGCDGTGIEAEATPGHSRFTVMCEVVEVFEYHYNMRPETAGGPWNCAITNGEGLSQALAKVVNYGQTASDFFGQAGLWNVQGRPNVFIATGQQVDKDSTANGGALLLLNWLRWGLGYTWQQIINAPGDCLDEVYHSLTGGTDSYTQLTTLLDSNGMAGMIIPENPFPLGWVVALQRPFSSGGTIAVHQTAEGSWRVLPELFPTPNEVTGAQVLGSGNTAYDDILFVADTNNQTFALAYWGTDAGMLDLGEQLALGIQYSKPRLATSRLVNSVVDTSHIIAIREPDLVPVHFTAVQTGNFKILDYSSYSTEVLNAVGGLGGGIVVDASLAGTGTNLHYLNVHTLQPGTNFRIYHRLWTSGAGWTPWGDLTAVAGLPSCPFAACAAWPDGQLAVMAITVDGRMLVTLRDPATGNWTAPTSPPYPPPNLRNVAAACVTPKEIKGVVVDAQGNPWTFRLLQSTGLVPRPTSLANLYSELGSNLGPVSGLSCARTGGPYALAELG